MALSEQYQQQIIDTIKQLPEDKLAEVIDFVTFLKNKYQPHPEKNRVKLGGLWEGFEPTDKEIQEARKEMWQYFDTWATQRRGGPKMASFTGLVKKEGNQYVSLCVELDIASCGHTKKEAIEGLKNAVEAYLEYMISEGRENEVYRPVPIKALKDFLFPECPLHEQSLKAIPLEFEYA